MNSYSEILHRGVSHKECVHANESLYDSFRLAKDINVTPIPGCPYPAYHSLVRFKKPTALITEVLEL